MTATVVNYALATYAHRLASIRAHDVSIDVAALRVADTIAAFVAGRRMQRSAASLADAAACASATRMTEIDDIHLGTCVTAGAIVVPVVLAYAARERVDGEMFRRGLAAGYATAIRFGHAVGGVSVIANGIWPTLAVARVTTAAIDGVMRGLESDRLETALAYALHGSVGRPPSPTTAAERWSLFASEVAAGLEACDAATTGCESERTGELPYRLNGELAAAPIAGAEMGEMSQKPFCTSRQALSGTCAFMQMLDDGARASDIRRVTVFVPRAYAWMIERDITAGDRLSTILGQRFQIATAAIDRSKLYDLARCGPHDPAVVEFSERVVVEGSDAFANVFPRSWPARVRIEFLDGSSRERTATSVLGDPSSPLCFSDLQRKSPAFTRYLFELCLRAPAEGPDALLAALAARPEGL